MQLGASELTALVSSWLWPLLRIAAMVMSAPVFGSRSVPWRVKLILSLAITLVVVPILPPLGPLDLFSPITLLLVVQQIMIGVLLGFSVQLVFSAVIAGGQMIAMQMGLGFAVMVDPQNGSQAPVLSQFYVLMIILVYLAMNGHLVIIEVMVQSFHFMPINNPGLAAANFLEVARWGSQIFAGGLAMAMPAIASLLVVNIAFGIMTRAAPQLNLFAIGFPVTMVLGFALVLITLSSALPQVNGLFVNVFHMLRRILTGAG